MTSTTPISSPLVDDSPSLVTAEQTMLLNRIRKLNAITVFHPTSRSSVDIQLKFWHILVVLNSRLEINLKIMLKWGEVNSKLYQEKSKQSPMFPGEMSANPDQQTLEINQEFLPTHTTSTCQLTGKRIITCWQRETGNRIHLLQSSQPSPGCPSVRSAAETSRRTGYKFTQTFARKLNRGNGNLLMLPRYI